MNSKELLAQISVLKKEYKKTVAPDLRKDIFKHAVRVREVLYRMTHKTAS